MLEDEILIQPQGPEGYGLLDYNHIRQFYQLQMQNRETEHKTLIDALQEEKKMLVAQFSDLDKASGGAPA